MITPFDRFVEFSVPQKANYRCLELSPDGTMLAAVSTNSVQIWSAQSEYILMASTPQNRPTGYSKALLNRVFVVWNDDSNQIVVIRSEGVADFYRIRQSRQSFNDAYEDLSLLQQYEKTTIERICSIAIDQYGFPLSVCSLYQRILILSDSGNISELNWNGEIVGCPFAKFIEKQVDSLPALSDTRPLYIASCSDLSCLALALDTGDCLLLYLSPTSILPTNATLIHPTLSDGIRQMAFASGLPYLAIVSSRLSVEVYSIVVNIDASFASKSINVIDIRQYPQLVSSPLLVYDTITTIAWCPGQPIVALGLKYQGIMVWTIEGTVLYSYNGYAPSLYSSVQSKGESPMSTIDDSEIEMALEVSCCCFNMAGTSLLFNIPYEQVIHQNNHIFCRDSRLLCQRFCVFPDLIYASYLAPSSLHS